MLKKLINNKYIFSLFTKFTLVLFGLLNSVFINRYLGPSLKGQYSYILNIVNLIVLILNLGIYQSYPNNKRKQISNIKQKYFNIFLLQFIIYLIIAIVLSVTINRLDYTIIFMLVPFAILAKQLNFITLIENINLRNMLNIGNQIFYTVTLFSIFIFSYRNLIYIISLLYIKDIIIILRIIFKFNFKVNLKCIDIFLLKDSIKFGFFPMLTLLLITMNYKFDVIILNMFVDFDHIGYYSVGVGLANQIWVIPDAFKDVLFSKTASKDSVEDIILSIKLNVYISLLAVIFIIFSGKYLISLLYGVEFLSSYKVTVILFLGIIPMIFFKLIYTLFIARGKQKLSFNILLISVILNIVGNFIFIPRFGIIGAAVTSVVSYFVCGCFFLYVFMKEYNLKIQEIVFLKNNEIKRLKFYQFKS